MIGCGGLATGVLTKMRQGLNAADLLAKGCLHSTGKRRVAGSNSTLGLRRIVVKAK